MYSGGTLRLFNYLSVFRITRGAQNLSGRQEKNKKAQIKKKDENEGKYSTIPMYAKINILLAVNFETKDMIPDK